MLDGLLSGIFGEMTDEKRQGLLAAAAAMMQSRGNAGQAAGAGLQHGLLGYQTARGLTDRRAEEAQMREMRAMQMEQMKRANADQAAVSGVYSRNTMPGNLTPNDDEGNPMPAAPQGLNLEGLKSGLLGAGPAGLREYSTIQSMFKKEEPKYHVVGNALVPEPAARGQSSTPAYQGPVDEWKDIGRDPKTNQLIQQNTRTGERKAVGSMPTQVTTNVQAGEKEEQKKLGELRVKNYGDLQQAAAAARKENALLSGLERIPIETGKLTPANATVAAWMVAAGAKDEDLKRVASGGQTFEAFTNDLVMQQQLAQKGPQTESDAKRLQMTQAQLSNTPEANALNIAYRKAMNNRLIEQERFNAKWSKDHKGTLEGADDAWFSGKGGTSIWEEPTLKKFQEKSPGGGETIDFSQLPRRR